MAPHDNHSHHRRGRGRILLPTLLVLLSLEASIVSCFAPAANPIGRGPTTAQGTFSPAFNVAAPATKVRGTTSSTTMFAQSPAVTMNGAGEMSALTTESGLRYDVNDWLSNILNFPNSYVLHRMQPHLRFNVAVSVIATMLHKYYPSRFTIPILGHNLLGGFLGLLLVFRQNTAYARFWDARCSWSRCAATTRNMALLITSFMRGKAPQSSKMLLKLVSAFPDALAYECLGGIYPLAHNVKKLVLPRGGGTKLSPAMVLLSMMHEKIHDISYEMGESRDPLDNFHLYDLSHCVAALSSSLKECQRLLNTPVPWSYSRHTSRFLTIYTATLPFAVVGTLGWFTPAVMAVLCWCLFGIEEIGHLIEQPFVGRDRSDRSLKTKPYDIGLPVFVLSNNARKEVEDIAKMVTKDEYCEMHPTADHCQGGH